MIRRNGSDGSYLVALSEALWHPEPQTRQVAAWILGKKKARQAVPALTRATAHFRDSDPYFVATAVRALGTIGDPQVIPLLAELLEGSCLAVRLAAVQALAHIGTPPALEALYRARADPSPTVQQVRQAINRILGASPAGRAPPSEERENEDVAWGTPAKLERPR
ncbi:MAG: HEAT repeat domain-containing protein [Firmicutes bacterium]|nr:HEAT repeat domain-containing protein [Bacillota bacterium]